MVEPWDEHEDDALDAGSLSPSFVARLKEEEEATKALLARPRVSLRVQVLLGFLVVFLFALIIAGVIIHSIYNVEDKIRVLEIVNEYVMEVDQARRIEKNFFLYGSDLQEALDAAHRAQVILEENRVSIGKVVGASKWRQMYRNVTEYERVLKQLMSVTKKGDAKMKPSQLRSIEVELRGKGQKMVLLAEDLVKSERTSLHKTIVASRRLQIYSLVFLLLFMISAAYLISGLILRSIERLKSYTDRIALGDFTPITPKRRYRDEFTDLSLAVNHMMGELQKHEAMLIQSHKMRAMGTLTAGVAHELNNPLNNINITAHMLLEDFEEMGTSECKEMVGDIVSEAERVKKIVASLLDFTRESDTSLEPIELVALVDETLSLARNQIRVAGINIEVDAMDDPPRIMGDRQQLTQVLLNLILNAIAASEKGGRLEIVVSEADQPGHLAIKVIDYGAGIPEHLQSRVFDPFFTTKAKGKGTGLGLSVTQGIVAKHGGRVLLESREGHGTTFTVILPTRRTDGGAADEDGHARG